VWLRKMVTGGPRKSEGVLIGDREKPKGHSRGEHRFCRSGRKKGTVSRDVEPSVAQRQIMGRQLAEGHLGNTCSNEVM